jgi:CheY-like chemotaxis protein
MNGVIGMTSLLRETAPLTEEQVDYIETIRSSGQTLLALINDVLDFSKIESNHLRLSPVPLDLHKCVEETLEVLAPLAREKRLDLGAEIDDSVPQAIRGDGVRLRQILTNLVGNAVKFTSEGEVVVELRAEPASGELHRLSFAVRDTGIGIQSDRLSRLFKPFSQADSSTTRVHGGTGLGLAISQRLVGLMEGTIEVVSEPGVGSVFSFEITLPTAPAPEAATSAPLPLGLAGRTVLIVDDNDTQRRIIESQLRGAECVTVSVGSGAAALAGLRPEAWPDLVITDFLMPEMDGLDFVLRLRELEREKGLTPPVPALLLSSGGYRPGDPRTERAQLAATLSKPVRRQHLIEVAARACRHAAATTRPLSAPRGPDELRSVATKHPHRILLVEDNPVNRKVAIAILRRLGYEADVAVNGAEAVEACRTKAYDLVFMDVQMPEVDGLEATRLVRQLPGTQPKIFAMTANAMAGDREQCIAAGMDDYVAKPIRLEDIRRAVAA